MVVSLLKDIQLGFISSKTLIFNTRLKVRLKRHMQTRNVLDEILKNRHDQGSDITCKNKETMLNR